MADERPQTNGQRLKQKLDAMADFLNRVGLPTFLVLVVVGLVMAVMLGYSPAPFMSNERSEAMFMQLIRGHEAMIGSLHEQTKVLQGSQELEKKKLETLEDILCEAKHSDKDRLECYRKHDQLGQK